MRFTKSIVQTALTLVLFGVGAFAMAVDDPLAESKIGVDASFDTTDSDTRTFTYTGGNLSYSADSGKIDVPELTISFKKTDGSSAGTSAGPSPRQGVTFHDTINEHLFIVTVRVLDGGGAYFIGHKVRPIGYTLQIQRNSDDGHTDYEYVLGKVYKDKTTPIEQNLLPASTPISITPETINITEQNAATYTIVLNTAPAANTTINILPTSSNTATLQVSGIVTFTTADWDTAQTITISAVEDINIIDENNISISHQVSGADFEAGTVTVNITDNNIGYIFFDGLIYKEVISPYSDRAWLDRNLGATATTGKASFGDLYQWGRAKDGHQSRSPNPPTSTTSISSITPQTDEFYIGNRDWTSGSADDRTEAWADGGINDICPPGFQVPDVATFNAETRKSFLNLALTDYRSYAEGILAGEGTGFYSSASHASGKTRVVFEATLDRTGSNGLTNIDRAHGFSVRCASKPDYITPITASLSPNTINITEQNTKTYTIVLNIAPAANSTINILPISNNTTVLRVQGSATFTTANWDTAQTITISAVEDTNTVSEDNTSISHQVSGADFEVRTTTVNITDDNTGYIIFNNVIYKRLASPNNRIWLDRNLGADNSADNGWYYQWGRGADGHQSQPATPSDEQKTNTLATSITPNHSQVIFGSNDWVDAGLDDNGAERIMAWANGGGNAICPPNFTVPSQADFEADGGFGFLNLPLSGVRGSDALINNDGGYWSIDAAGNDSTALIGNTDFVAKRRGFGYSVRCINYVRVHKLTNIDATANNSDTDKRVFDYAGGVVSNFQPLAVGNALDTVDITSGSYTIAVNGVAVTRSWVGKTVNIIPASADRYIVAKPDNDANLASLVGKITIANNEFILATIKPDGTIITNAVAGSLAAATITANNSINEGEVAEFVVTLDPVPVNGEIEIKYELVEAADFVLAADKGLQSVNLTFTNGVATLQIATIDNNIDEADGEVRIILQSGSGYEAGNPNNTAVTVRDNDAAGVSVSTQSLEVREGGTNEYEMVLDTRPNAIVTISISERGGFLSIAPTVVFSPDRWDVSQTVTISANQDADGADNNNVTIIHGVSGYGAINSADGVAVSIIDDDVREVNISASDLNISEGGDASYTISITTEPVGVVTITVESDNAAAEVRHSVLTFSGDERTKTITITAIEDDNTVFERAVITHTISGGDYARITATTTIVAISDNDNAAILLSGSDLNVPESGSLSYDIRLKTQPTSTVTIDISADNASAITIDKAQVIFSSRTWNIAQIIEVSGVNDTDVSIKTSQITHTASGDNDYNLITKSISASTIDDDGDGISLSNTSISIKEGQKATYTLNINTNPNNAITITFTIDNPAATIAQTLTITAGDWQITQTITITSIPDLNATDEILNITHAINGYSGVTSAPTITVTIDDPDTQKINLSPNPLTITENATSTYTITLATQPESTTTISITSPLTQPNTITFNPNNYQTSQTISIFSPDDGQTTNTITQIPHTASGGGYDLTEILQVAITNTTNNPPITTTKPVARTVLISELRPFNSSQTFNISRLFQDQDALIFTATSSDKTIATAEINGNNLTITQKGKNTSTVTITLTATDTQSQIITQTFTLLSTNLSPAAANLVITSPKIANGSFSFTILETANREAKHDNANPIIIEVALTNLTPDLSNTSNLISTLPTNAKKGFNITKPTNTLILTQFTEITPDSTIKITIPFTQSSGTFGFSITTHPTQFANTPPRPTSAYTSQTSTSKTQHQIYIFTPQTYSTPAPQLLSATPIKNQKIKLKYSPPTSTTSTPTTYNIYYTTTPPATPNLFDHQKANSTQTFYITPTLPIKPHYFIITTQDDLGFESPSSNQLQATPIK